MLYDVQPHVVVVRDVEDPGDSQEVVIGIGVVRGGYVAAAAVAVHFRILTSNVAAWTI